jgi:xylan 1,4-beta-xylosidase
VILNYHDDDLPALAVPIDLSLNGLKGDTKRALVEHFRVDTDHSNAYATWKEMGAPQTPSDRQNENLRTASQLQLLDSPSWLSLQGGSMHLQFSLPRQGLSLLRITW